jgi:hypothetical protein
MILVLRLLAGVLFAFALFNALRVRTIDHRMRAYRSAGAPATAFLLPPPLRWQIQHYDLPAYPLIDQAWQAFTTMFLSALAGMVLVALSGA